MGVYKEIAKADGSGITTFYRLSEEKSTVETTSTGTTETMFDYNDTLNKPSINDIALVGNKTLDELGIQPAGDYITEIPAEYITEDELEAKDYATEAFVIEQINNAEHFRREIVDALPLTGKDNILYLVPKKGSDKDIYNEYIWTGVDYEFMGTTAIDLTDYYQKGEVDELLDNKVTKVSGKQLSTNDYTTAEKTKLASLENYDDSELQSEVTELNANVSSLEASNTNLYNTVSHLKPIVNDNASSIIDIYNSLDDKITAIRLVAQGDGWIWMDLKGNKLLYPQVSTALGHENCVLFIEQLENDGKIIPAEYKIQGEHIDVTYKDLDGKIHFMTCGDDVYTLETTSSTTGVITTEEISQEASGYNLHSISIDGKSKQETRSGKNLFNSSLFSNATTNRITLTKNVNGTITLNGTAAALTDFNIIDLFSIDADDNTIASITKLSGSFTNDKSNISIEWNISDDSWGNRIYTNLDGVNYNPSTGKKMKNGVTYKRCTLRVQEGVTCNNLVLGLQIEKSQTATEFEPYGVSPSPDYPSEIKTVRGIRNLFDKDNANILNLVIDVSSMASSNYGKSFYIKCNPNTTYTISREIIGSRFVVGTTANIPTSGETVIDRIVNNSGSSITLTTSPTANYLCVYYLYNSSENEQEILDSIQIEQGSVAHDYVPYGSWLKVKVTGNNILNPNEMISGGYSISSGNYFSSEASFCTNKKIKIDNKKPYYLSHNITNEGQYYYVLYYDENNNYIGNYSLPMKTKTMNLGNFTKYSQVKYINIRFDVPISQMNNIQLKDKLTEYEPYQEQEVLIDMNKPNLFDKTKVNELKAWINNNNGLLTANQSTNSIIVNVEKNTDYTISKIAGNKFRIGFYNSVPTGEETLINFKSNDTGNIITANSGDNTYLIVYYYDDNSENYTKQEMLDSIKIYEGYDPYYEICSIENTKDNLEVVSGLLTRKIGKVVLDGSEDWVLNGNQFAISGVNYKTNSDGALWLNTHFQQNVGNDKSLWIGNSAFIVIRYDEFKTTDELKKWLSNNPVTVYYVLAEPQIINTTSTNIKTFEGTNNISLVSSLEPSNFEVTYLKDLVINATDTVLGKDTYWNDDVPTVGDLPTDAREGEIRIVKDTEYIYIYDGIKWIPFDKTTEVDLSNYLSKDNTIAYKPATDYNPSTKKYVDDSIADIFVPTKTSQLTNDSGFVLKSVNDLTNYYNKSNTYNKAEVNALVSGGGGGDSKIETLDITGGKDITALLTPGTHLYYLQGGEEDDLTIYAYYRDRDSYDTIHLYSGTLISVDYYVEAEDGEIHILYIDPQQGFGWLEYYGTPTKRTKLTNASVYDVGYIKASTNKLIANLLSNRINIVTEDTTISVYLNGSTSLTDLLLPTNTILIGKGIEFSGVMNTGGLIIKPDMTMYMITTSPLANLKVSELKLVTSDTLTSTLNNYATKSYADNCRLENSTPIEGTDIFGWYATTQDGTALTHATPQMIESIAIGEVYEWPSNVYTDGTNSAVVTGITKSYDHWSATRASGGESNYKEFIVYMGNHNVYTFAFDDTTVYKETYPSDK